MSLPAGISGFAWRFFPRSGETPTERITNGGLGGKAWFQATARSNARGNVFWMSFDRRRFVGLLGMVWFGSAWLRADGPIIARRAAQQGETSGSERGNLRWRPPADEAGSSACWIRQLTGD